MKNLQQLETEPDLIPTSSMADIAFLLIIYFMITITFSATQGLDMAMPEEAPSTVTERGVLVAINADNSLTVDGASMPLSGLLPYLAPKLKHNPHKPVIIYPDPQAHYGAMVGVYDELLQGKQKLGLQKDIQIALPTRCEVERFWH